MFKGMWTVKHENFTNTFKIFDFVQKFQNFVKSTTPPKLIISSNCADKDFIIMLRSFCQMEFDYF